MPGIDIASATTTKFGGADGVGKTIARTSSTTRNGSILGGQITFTSITAVAEDKFNGSTHVRSAAGTVFSGLKIDGKSIDNPSANLRPLIRVSGYGLVYVNEQIIPAAASRTKMKINGLRVVIDTVPERSQPAARHPTLRRPRRRHRGSLTRAQPASFSSPMPPATMQAAVMRSRPKGSPRSRVPMIVARMTLVSRRPET